MPTVPNSVTPALAVGPAVPPGTGDAAAGDSAAAAAAAGDAAAVDAAAAVVHLAGVVLAAHHVRHGAEVVWKVQSLAEALLPALPAVHAVPAEHAQSRLLHAGVLAEPDSPAEPDVQAELADPAL